MTMQFEAMPGLTTLGYPIKLAVLGCWLGALCALRRPHVGGWGALFHRGCVAPEPGSGATQPILSRRPSHGSPGPRSTEGGVPTSWGSVDDDTEDGTGWTPTSNRSGPFS